MNATRRPHRLNPRPGLSLPEMLIALAISALLLLALTVAFSASVQSYKDNQESAYLSNSARLILNRILTSVRKADAVDVDPNGARISMMLPTYILISNYDTDGDDALTATEYTGGIPPFAELDTDGDGFITVDDSPLDVTYRYAAPGPNEVYGRIEYVLDQGQANERVYLLTDGAQTFSVAAETFAPPDPNDPNATLPAVTTKVTVTLGVSLRGTYNSLAANEKHAKTDIADRNNVTVVASTVPRSSLPDAVN